VGLAGGSDLIILYYCLMATWTGLGDNTELFWVVLSQLADCPPVARGPSACCDFFACSSSSFELARRSFEVSKFHCGVFVRPSV
jgi:hypothetical protein